LIVQSVSEISNVCGHNPPMSDRPTDRRTDDMQSQSIAR